VDLASLIGLVLALIGVFVGMTIKGADPVAMFTNVPALLIVIVGSLGAVVMSNGMETTTSALKAFLKIFMPGKPPQSAEAVELFSQLAERARTAGLLGLEEDARNIDDPFLRKGVQLAIDGADAEALQDALEAEVKAMKERHKAVANWFQQMGIFAPTFGIIGAVVGLIAVLAKLDDPSKLGKGIGAAFVATFWGVFMANGMFLPWANKLKAMSAAEVAHRELTIQGVLALQTGTSPRAVVEKLNGYLPPAARKAS
jgi:chemotaxis protein MotA